MHSFKKAEHLKSRKSIELLFNEGESIFNYPVKAVWHCSKIDHTQKANVKAGFSVSTRKYKRAVDRNRIKRIMREAYRLNKAELHELVQNSNLQMQLMFIYVSDKKLAFAEIQDVIIITLDRLKTEILNGNFK